MDAFYDAWRRATIVQRCTLIAWGLIAAAFFAIALKIQGGFSWAGAGLTGIVFGGAVFVALSPKLGGGNDP